MYSCKSNEYSCGYIAKGMCEKGRVNDGMKYFKEMREKGLMPMSNLYVKVICGLALERMLNEGVELLEDMLENKMKPNLLTYMILLVLCKDGRGELVFEELGSRSWVG